MCEQCWDTEYVYDAITALGSMHRATLLLSQGSEDDGNRGLDTKVIACQAYSRALQGFSNADKTTICFVGVIILCAYFEVNSSAVPYAALFHFSLGFIKSPILTMCSVLQETFPQQRGTFAQPIITLGV